MTVTLHDLSLLTFVTKKPNNDIETVECVVLVVLSEAHGRATLVGHKR